MKARLCVLLSVMFICLSISQPAYARLIGSRSTIKANYGNVSSPLVQDIGFAQCDLIIPGVAAYNGQLYAYTRNILKFKNGESISAIYASNRGDRGAMVPFPASNGYLGAGDTVDIPTGLPVTEFEMRGAVNIRNGRVALLQSEPLLNSNSDPRINVFCPYNEPPKVTRKILEGFNKVLPFVRAGCRLTRRCTVR